MPRKAAAQTKLFVLDTNVLMHDPTSLFRFEEHDIYVPIATLEELDLHKKGMTEVSRNARQASRFIDEIVSKLDSIEDGVPLAPHSHNAASGKLFLQTQAITGDIPMSLPTSKVDNQILGVVLFAGIAYLLDPLLHRIGLALLTAAPIEGLWTALYNSTIWRIQRFNNSVVMGSLAFGVLCFVPLVLFSNVLIRRYREHVLAWVRKTRLMQAITASKFYEMYTKVSGWGWGGLS